MQQRRHSLTAILLTSFFLVFSLSFVHEASAADIDRLEGYAWSSNIGWLSFSCHNADSCGSSNYGVTMDKDTGGLGGYAWSSNIGWLSFNPEDVSGCPLAPCAPKIVGGVASGWARALVGDAENGWEGWIHLSGSDYGVTLLNTEFGGLSWSNDVIGWLDWAPSQGPGVYLVASSIITTGVSGGGSNSDVRIGADVCGGSSCSYAHETGELVDLFANPGGGYIFSTWTGANASECPSLTDRICDGIVLDADKEIKAVFRVVNCPTDGPGYCPACNDTIDNDADGKTDFPADSNCPSAGGLSESVTVAACDNCLDDDGDGKIDWSNDTGCQDDPADNNEINAVLTAAVVFDGGATGRITSDPVGINCGTSCSKEYTNDDQIRLTATPGDSASNFWRWSGSCLGTNPSCELSMNISRTVTAFFGTTRVPNCPALGPGPCPECNDGADNDADGDIDYPFDAQCTDREDPTEGENNLPQCPALGVGICPQCNDNFDNDADGGIDYKPGNPAGDAECTSLNDDNEFDTGIICPAAGVGVCPECNDNFDNDGDRAVDFPQDLQCSSVNDNSESGTGVTCPADGPGLCPVCNDGIDNDGDGFLDYLEDPDCNGDPNGGSEDGIGPNCPADGPGVCPQCNDGIDNADPEDTIADYPNDRGCYSRADNNETDPVIVGNCPADGPGLCPKCNDGIDNDGDGFVDWFGWDGDRNGTREIPRDPSCQGEPNKDTEAGDVIIIEV
jgi:hypothetical protein